MNFQVNLISSGVNAIDWVPEGSKLADEDMYLGAEK